MAVAAYEIVKCNANAPFLPCGYTLRFPRCACIRNDKGWDECMTHDEVVAMFGDGKAKIAASKRSAADVAAANPDDLQFGGGGGKRGRKAGEGGGRGAAAGGRAVGVVSHLRLDSAALRAVQRTSDMRRITPWSRAGLGPTTKRRRASGQSASAGQAARRGGARQLDRGDDAADLGRRDVGAVVMGEVDGRGSSSGRGVTSCVHRGCSTATRGSVTAAGEEAKEEGEEEAKKEAGS